MNIEERTRWYKDYLDNIQVVYSIFVDTYGEDRVDLQCSCTLDRFLSPDITIGSLKDATEYLKTSIIVFYPEVIIRNERDNTHTIKELFVRTLINYHGYICGSPSFKRSRYTLAEVNSNYLHSHVLVEFPADFRNWKFSCLGDGPIRQTIADLHSSNAYDRWLLYTVQLDQYVHTESLDGGPYKRLSTIMESNGHIAEEYYFETSSSPKMKAILAMLPTSPLTPEDLKEFTSFFCERFLSYGLFISYEYGIYKWGTTFVDSMIIISNAFIDWWNNYRTTNPQCPFDSLLETNTVTQSVVSGSVIYTSLQQSIPPNIKFLETSPIEVCTFKQVPQYLNIKSPTTKYAPLPNSYIFLNSKIVSAIITSIIVTLNLHYGTS